MRKKGRDEYKPSKKNQQENDEDEKLLENIEPVATQNKKDLFALLLSAKMIFIEKRHRQDYEKRWLNGMVENAEKLRRRRTHVTLIKSKIKIVASVLLREYRMM